MRKTWVRDSRRGFGYLQMVIAISVFIILCGIGAQGVIWVRGQAETTSLISRANEFGSALQLYYQAKRAFPDAYPSNLPADLGPYISNATFFNSPAHPGEGATPLNNAYVTPIPGDANCYVLSLDSCREADQAVVLFADMSVELVQEMPAYRSHDEIKPGTTVTGGTITTGNGSTFDLAVGTTATFVESFRAADGTPFDVVKVNQGQTGKITVTALGTTIVEVASEAGITYVRTGKAVIEFLQEGGQDRVKVTAIAGEVVANTKITERGPRDTGVPVSGGVNINPNNNTDFEFTLVKTDGSVINRDNLLANRDLVDNGPASWLQFKPKGNGNQNSLVVNGTLVQLQNGTLYTITASPSMTYHLYNEKRGTKGKAMGRWWIDNIVAPYARIVDENGTLIDGNVGNGYNNDVFIGSGAPTTGGSRVLAHGSTVPKDFWVKGTK